MLKRAFLLLAAAALPAARCPAAVDLELAKPYDLRIVLHVADHKLLGELFRERVTRELRDGMQAALGDLAKVTVVHDHPRLKDVLSRGLDRALDGWVERSDVKTHFVLIDYSGVHYEIQARQHDGLTGRASRVVRRDRTRDRDFVSKAAAMLVAHDFGLVGTLVGAPDDQKRVKVELKAGALGSLARWVRKGQVFEIVPPGGTAALDWALVQVIESPADEARDGVIPCKLWHRYKLGNLEGHRCLALGTTRGPLKLRFMTDKGRGVRVPLDLALGLDIRRHGFEGEEATLLHKNTDEAGQAGWVDTSRDGDKGVFEDVAFVRVKSGMAPPLPQIPVPVIDDRPVVIPIAVVADAGHLFASHRATWERNVSDSVLLQITLFNEIKDLGSKPDGRALALEKARAGHKRTKDDLESLKEERAALVAEGGATFKPAREDQRLKDLEEGAAQLKTFLEGQEQIEREENDPKKRAWRSEIQRARLLEQDAEVGKALAIYEKVLKEGLESPELRKHMEDLKKQWAPADDKHAEARAFIYNLWPALDTAGLKQRLAEAEQAFAECRRVKDVIAPRKLFKATEAHAVRLAKELSELQPKINIDDEKPARLIEEVSAGLLKLAGDVQVYLQKMQPVEP